MKGPVEAFHRLFSKDTTPIDQQRAMLAQKRSVLDTIKENAKALQKKLGKTDNAKLDDVEALGSAVLEIGLYLLAVEFLRKEPRGVAQPEERRAVVVSEVAQIGGNPHRTVLGETG